MPQNRLKINFIGSFTQGYVGEVADEVHLANELENLGHDVVRVPRDIWKAFVDGDKPNDDWVIPKEADINIICKWHHFDDEKYVYKLKSVSGAPVFYWVWDYMDYGHFGFHYKMASACDLLLTGEGGKVRDLRDDGITATYFQFDVCDGEFGMKTKIDTPKKYDTVFFGTHLGQGDRVEWIKEINKTHKVTVFSWNHNDWIKDGIEAYPAVYGDELTQRVNESKIILGFNVNDHCWGYWSNRVGKTLTRGGFLLQRYVPGMEVFIGDGAEYFSSIEEANAKISYFLDNENERRSQQIKAFDLGYQRFTSKVKVKQLVILIERFMKGGL